VGLALDRLGVRAAEPLDRRQLNVPAVVDPATVREAPMPEHRRPGVPVALERVVLAGEVVAAFALAVTAGRQRGVVDRALDTVVVVVGDVPVRAGPEGEAAAAGLDPVEVDRGHHRVVAHLVVGVERGPVA